MARPALPEPADRDRLFVRCILNDRARSLFGDNLQALIDMSTENRWRIVHSASDDDGDDTTEVEPLVQKIIAEAVSDVEAWIAVERARHASRAAQRKRRGLNRGQ